MRRVSIISPDREESIWWKLSAAEGTEDHLGACANHTRQTPLSVANEWVFYQTGWNRGFNNSSLHARHAGIFSCMRN